MYKTTRDIIIPAGTEVTAEPPHSREYMTDHALVLIEVTPDITAEWNMDLEEAISSGLVTEEEEPASDAEPAAEAEAEAGPID